MQAGQELAILQTQECVLDVVDVNALDQDGIPLEVEVDCSPIKFVKENVQVLGAHAKDAVSDSNPQQAVIADMLSSLIIV